MNKIEVVVVSEFSDPVGYIVQIFVDELDGTEILILKIEHNYYFPDVMTDQPGYHFIISKSLPFINFNVSIPLTAIRYSYNKEEIIDARRGFVILNQISIYKVLDLLLSSEFDSSVWQNEALVKMIEGPFQDGKLTSEIDLSKDLYYLASANSDVHNSQLLSIKWEYQYNTGNFNKFRYSKRSVVQDGGVNKCRLDCAFEVRDDIFDVTLFAFFRERSAQIFNKTNTTNKKLEGGKLIWSANVTAEFESKVIQICSDLYGDTRKMEMANALMAVMAVETAKTFKAHIIAGQNAKTLIPPDKITKDDFKLGANSSKAVGLIQFTQSAIEQIGDFKSGTGFDKLHEVKLSYARMGEIKQLDKVKLYLQPSKNNIKKPEDIYLQVFAPKGVGQNDNFVLYKSPSTEYTQNKSLDDDGNKNGKIERIELLQRYYKLYEEGEKSIRSAGGDNGDESDPESDSTFNAKDVVTFNIYSDGRVEKHIPKVVAESNKKKYKYVYHDAKKKAHEICTVDWDVVQKRKNGKPINPIPSGYIDSYDYPAGGNATKAYVYSNGDIVATGTVYGTKIYAKDIGTVELVRMKDSLKYDSDGVKVYYSFFNTQRRYCNPETYAGFIGALAHTNRTDVLCYGMCFGDATSYPSLTHPNGDSADSKYLSNLTDEQIKVNGFIKFHFQNILRGNTSWFPQLKGTKYSSGHEDHLHAGDFDSTKLKIVNE